MRSPTANLGKAKRQISRAEAIMIEGKRMAESALIRGSRVSPLIDECFEEREKRAASSRRLSEFKARQGKG